METPPSSTAAPDSTALTPQIPASPTAKGDLTAKIEHVPVHYEVRHRNPMPHFLNAPPASSRSSELRTLDMPLANRGTALPADDRSDFVTLRRLKEEVANEAMAQHIAEVRSVIASISYQPAWLNMRDSLAEAASDSTPADPSKRPGDNA